VTDAATRADDYPSRVSGDPARSTRLDPVVHGSPGDGPLSPGALASFERDGFLVCEELLDPDEAASLLADVRRLTTDPGVAASERSIVEPNGGAVRSIFDVHRRDPSFVALAVDPRLLGIARQLMGSDVYVHQSRVNLKPGFRGQEFYWHSDFETWHVEDGMPRMRAVSCSVLLTENHAWNGPLMLIAGSHRWYVACVGETPDDHYQQSLRKQEYGVPDDASLTRLTEEGSIEVPTGAPGSVVFFDCNVMHGSNGNITPHPRSNAFFVYNSVENALVEPFGGRAPRPEFVASRDFSPVASGGGR